MRPGCTRLAAAITESEKGQWVVEGWDGEGGHILSVSIPYNTT